MASSQSVTTLSPGVLEKPAIAGSWSDWIRSGEWQAKADTTVTPLPALAQEIFNLSLDPDVSASRLTAIVSKDPVLATRVVQLANSAFSASAIRITTINDAVVRVGTSLVRNVLTSTCMAALAQDPHIYGRRGGELIEHSMGSAYIAWLVAETAGESPSEAFLYTLLHDIGKLLIMKLARHAWRYQIATPTEDELEDVLRDQHTIIGAHLLKQWGLPEKLHDPIMFHHEPARAQQEPQAAAVTYAADRLADRYGFACDPDKEFEPLVDPVFTQLGIDAALLAMVDTRAPVLFEMARMVAY